jgi:hypothetical protein
VVLTDFRADFVIVWTNAAKNKALNLVVESDFGNPSFTSVALVLKYKKGGLLDLGTARVSINFLLIWKRSLDLNRGAVAINIALFSLLGAVKIIEDLSL